MHEVELASSSWPVDHYKIMCSSIATLDKIRRLIVSVALILLISVGGEAQAEPDLGKRACAKEARRLCPAEMRKLKRSLVEACMIAKIDQTSPACHAAMLRIKAEREAAKKE